MRASIVGWELNEAYVFARANIVVLGGKTEPLRVQRGSLADHSGDGNGDLNNQKAFKMVKTMAL